MRPFLKWAGGKHRLVRRIRQALPPGDRLVEPFLGSGAVFLNCDYPRYLLSDSNADLINLYRQLQIGGPSFIDYCRSFFTPAHNNAETYYALRARFNETAVPAPEKAALFLYLNRHGYNGLCRYNAGGGFNVPFGRYKRPYFPAAEMAHFQRRAARAVFKHQPFTAALGGARLGDVVYCDPPYVPLSATANFTSYHPGGFGDAEQEQLARQARQLAGRGIPVVISNHSTRYTRHVYAGARITSFNVRRTISRNGHNRGVVRELLAIFSPAGA